MSERLPADKEKICIRGTILIGQSLGIGHGIA